MPFYVQSVTCLNPKIDTPLFAPNANPLQLYHSHRAKILAFKLRSPQKWLLTYLGEQSFFQVSTSYTSVIAGCVHLVWITRSDVYTADRAAVWFIRKHTILASGGRLEINKWFNYKNCRIVYSDNTEWVCCSLIKPGFSKDIRHHERHHT